jgi:hypothetical protein
MDILIQVTLGLSRVSLVKTVKMPALPKENLSVQINFWMWLTLVNSYPNIWLEKVVAQLAKLIISPMGQLVSTALGTDEI